MAYKLQSQGSAHAEERIQKNEEQLMARLDTEETALQQREQQLRSKWESEVALARKSLNRAFEEYRDYENQACQEFRKRQLAEVRESREQSRVESQNKNLEINALAELVKTEEAQSAIKNQTFATSKDVLKSSLSHECEIATEYREQSRKH